MAASLPLRWRLTLGFAAGMALVLIALGVFVHARLRADLTSSIDEGLLSQAQFVSTAADRGQALSSSGAIVEADDALAQIVDASGEVVAFASPLASDPFLTPGALDAVHGRCVLRNVGSERGPAHTCAGRGAPGRILRGGRSHARRSQRGSERD